MYVQQRRGGAEAAHHVWEAFMETCMGGASSVGHRFGGEGQRRSRGGGSGQERHWSWQYVPCPRVWSIPSLTASIERSTRAHVCAHSQRRDQT